MSFDYPDIVEVVAFHDVLIEEFGGTMGMRDEGALASVIMRPVCDFTVRAKTPSLLRMLLEEDDILRVGPAPEKPDGETYALFLDGRERSRSSGPTSFSTRQYVTHPNITTAL